MDAYVEPKTRTVKLRAALGIGVAAVGCYWLAYWILWLDAGERALVRSLARPGRG